MGVFDYVWAGVMAVIAGPAAFEIMGIGVPITVLMTAAGFLLGILGGATPGLAGPFLMAVSLPILLSIFGFTPDALLPVMGFLVGVMKGATVGGAVPAILFNTPGTPDAMLTTLDGYPMAQKGQAGKALRTAHFASVTGDTFSDLVLFTCAPFLAIVVEAYLGFGEKAALILLSLAFVAAVVGASPMKGLIAAFLGLFVASVGTGEDVYSRLSMGTDVLSTGFPLITAVLGVLILGEVLFSFEQMWRNRRDAQMAEETPQSGDNRLTWGERRRLMPYISISALIGTGIGALPGIGSTLAATLGYATGQKMHKGPVRFGQGTPEGIAATEAANSSVSGANLIPVLSLGIPGNVGAVFLILAAESIGGFNPGPSVFRFSTTEVNPELVIAFGFFTTMMLANLMNWAVGGQIMRATGIMARIPKTVLMPIVLLLTLTAIYVQETDFTALYFAMGFALLGWGMRKLSVPILPFVIAFILAGNLEQTVRQAFAASGGDPWFLFQSPLSVTFLILGVLVILFFLRKPATEAKA
ncbi:tripartite tricarboxylate transporter permease [Mameliella sediminis]|uniref:tripartite tricarboxylate transporter permease n=1 Tax=Mameliella sediminis TaxID=2836866 RepID=UPI001C46DF58|nr:tripartite tricarboxylate transporter permease [Mameliella sediminis]MBV7394782.1 tripartite tricarboxylate transporter permease [Mameliella sediminis]MBY6163231.1 tripartite tricarboxylate transporter permease [Mameliella alba]MBY6171495.1 tripartite tricarboxylate transporter permease [Mameliella alba]MBY6176719.1 tripartite tricarboxylate transporter permease [Mameliella alba]